jgi:dTDP-alpha-D-glucuronic acid decarboxylase
MSGLGLIEPVLCGGGPMARIALVTGGSGFVGGHLSEQLVDSGWAVRVLDVREPGLDRPVDWICADVRDGVAMAQAATGVDVVFHLGAVVGVERLLEDPVHTIDVAVNGTLGALEAAAAASAALVHLSTSEVLGLNADPPWSEDADRVIGSALTDRWSYAAAKAAAEHLVLAGSPSRGVPATVIRPFNVYGPRQEERFVVPAMVGAALRGEPITVNGDGQQTRCFTFVDDVVAGILAAGEKPGVGRLLHLGSTEEVSISGLASMVLDATGSNSIVVGGDPSARWGVRYQDIPRRIPDPSNARAVLGWSSRTSLQEGLERTVAWARSSCVSASPFTPES